MLIIASLEGAVAAFEAARPAYVISILSEDEVTPTFAGLAEGAHLKLYVERESCSRSINDAARRRAGELVRFAREWDGNGDLMIHCNRGISRSTAAAFIIQCMMMPDIREDELIGKLRRAAPHADPCPLLVSYADEILARGGAMLEAVEDLPPPTALLCAPVVTLPAVA